MGSGVNIVEAGKVLALIATSVLLAGCVSTVGDPAQRTAVVANADTDPRALVAAKRKALEQRQELIRQPIAIAATREEGIGLLNFEALTNVEFTDLAGGGRNEALVVPAGQPVVAKEVSYLATEGIPALPGVRLLGVAAGQDGSMRYMVKQKDLVAGILGDGDMLQVGGETYKVRGLGVASVVVEDTRGSRYLVTR